MLLGYDTVKLIFEDMDGRSAARAPLA